MEPSYEEVAVPSEMTAAWVPFGFFCFFCLCISTWFCTVKNNGNSMLATLASTISLFFTLSSGILIPLDVFVVSYIKFPNGTYKSWAEDLEVRESIQETVLQAYYVVYGVILVFAVLVLPLVCSPSLKVPLITLITFGIVLVPGIFIPFDGPPPANATWFEKLEFIVEEFNSSHGDNLIAYVISIVNMIGMLLIAIYLAHGMSSFLNNMLNSISGPCKWPSAAIKELKELEEKEIGLTNRREEQTRVFEDRELRELKENIQTLRRVTRWLKIRCVFINCCFVVHLAAIIFFASFGVIIYFSILLTSIDRSNNSLGPKSGYMLHKATMANPMDSYLISTQETFLLDYFLLTGFVFYLACCAMSAFKKQKMMGLACVQLSFIMMAFNVIIFAAIPDYSTFGSQHFIINATNNNASDNASIERCRNVLERPAECDITRIASLLLGFHSKVWFFEAAYFWLTWVFLLMVVVMALVQICRSCRGGTSRGQDDLTSLLNSGSMRYNRNYFTS